MKKNYLAPELQTVIIDGEKLMSDTTMYVGDNSQKINNVSNAGWAKGNSGTSNTSVWDDDWSQN